MTGSNAVTQSQAMSAGWMAAALRCAVLFVMLGPVVAWAQTSQMIEVPGSRVAVRTDSGWSYDLMLWEEHVLNDDEEFEFERFILRGWATTPDLDSFDMRIVLSPEYLRAKHEGWVIQDDGIASGVELTNNETFRTDQRRGDRATITLGDDRARLVVTASEAYRSALARGAGIDATIESIAYWYSLASVFEGVGAEGSVSLVQCRDTARDICTQTCTQNATPRSCIKTLSFDAATGACSFTCFSFAECCASPSPTP